MTRGWLSFGSHKITAEKLYKAQTVVFTGCAACRGESSPASFSDSSLADTLGVESHDVMSVLTVYSHSDVAIYRHQHIVNCVVYQCDNTASLSLHSAVHQAFVSALTSAQSVHKTKRERSRENHTVAVVVVR